MSAPSRAVDITGQTFGYLTAVERVPSGPDRKAAVWRCSCLCGGETIADGVALRKGDRRSCGCRNPRRKRTEQGDRVTKDSTSTEVIAETTWWVVEESDRTTFLLRHISRDQAAVVEHDGQRWMCTEDGPQQATGVASNQCAHVRVVARNLPVATALRIASAIAGPRRATPRAVGAETMAEKTLRETRAATLAAGARIRDQRAREHDRTFSTATGEVVVRKMTEADRQKLEKARARKRQTFSEGERRRS